MSENIFLAALRDVASGSLALTALIDTASTLTAQGHSESARKLYTAWISANPAHPLLYVAEFNVSALHSQAGDHIAAHKSLQHAIELNADFIPAYINLGGILDRSGAADKAIELWTSAVNRPLPVTGNAVNYAAIALKQIARVLSERQDQARAEAAIRQCLEINPHQPDVMEQYVALRLAQCEWPIIMPSERMSRAHQMKGIHPLSMAVYTDDPFLQLACADRYVRQSLFDHTTYVKATPPPRPIDLTARPLRVGYISSDLRDHAVGYLMAEFLELHAKSGVEVFLYYCGPETQSPLSHRIRAAVPHWLDIRSLSDDAAAARIVTDGIDILVDVNGHTRDARTGVFARSPAPIQVNWLGYPGTMASPFHHYIIADDWIIPPGNESFYSEKVLRLPCYQPNDRKREVDQTTPSRADAGLPEDAFVFCSFNGTHKISKFTFDRWLSILNQVPGSVLWLLETTQETKDRLRTYAGRQGIAAERFIFAPKVKNALHLARYPLADLFLDTLPYGAHTTASDALWMGVPVVTVSGRSFASRVCGSLVRAAGLDDLVFDNVADYVNAAVSIGLSPARVQDLKSRLANVRTASRLFNSDELVSSINELYFAMVRDYQAGRLPCPDLDNLEAYLEVGINLDHEADELATRSDYEQIYLDALSSLHAFRPMKPDTRLWSLEAIERAQGRLGNPRGIQRLEQVQPAARILRVS